MKTRMLIGLPFLAATLATGPALAATWTVDPKKSEILMSGEEFYFNTTQTAEFTEFTADITFDPEDLSSASVIVKMDAASIDAGSEDGDSTLMSDTWFAPMVEAFRYPTFTSKSFTLQDDGSYEVVADLQIRDIVLEVTLPFTLDIKGDKAVMEGALTLNRQDFGVGSGSKEDEKIGAEIEVEVKITAKRAD